MNLQTAKRRFHANPHNPEIAAIYLRELMKIDLIPEAYVRLAAASGHPVASLFFPDLDIEDLNTDRIFYHDRDLRTDFAIFLAEKAIFEGEEDPEANLLEFPMGDKYSLREILDYFKNLVKGNIEKHYRLEETLEYWADFEDEQVARILWRIININRMTSPELITGQVVTTLELLGKRLTPRNTRPLFFEFFNQNLDKYLEV